MLYFSEYDDYVVDSEERLIYKLLYINYDNCLPQTVHTIEKIFIPTDLPFVTRRRARKIFDIALIKLGGLRY